MSTVRLSERALHTDEQPITYFLKHAMENPHLVSLAAGFVDQASLPAAETQAALDEILSDPTMGRAAMQYGTTQGYAPLRDKILNHIRALDDFGPADRPISLENVVVGNGSQQLLYLIGEALLDPGDIVIAEGPSYFVYHGALQSFGVRTLQVPMDDDGMDTDALEALLLRLERSGEIERVKMIYTVDYFQNPSGRTLSLKRRERLVELARRFSKSHTILILEDAAYRELRYDGDDLPSLLQFDPEHKHVMLTMTFSKPLAPGFKTGYGILPKDVIGPVLRFKGNHDFGSSNLSQMAIDRMWTNGSYHRHVELLKTVYRSKRDAMLESLSAEFPAVTGAHWTCPHGGLYVWLTMPDGMPTDPDSPLMKAALAEGVLYIPASFCYVKGSGARNDEMRLSFGVANEEQIREGIARLARAARQVGLPRVSLPRLAGCRA
jgi:2-aminoadipate transaminase